MEASPHPLHGTDWAPVRLRTHLWRLSAVLKQHRSWSNLVLGLLAADLVFVAMYAVTRTLRALEIDPGLLGTSNFRITTEGGYPEIFNYCKTLGVVFLIWRLARLTRQPIYAALAAVYGMILLDDALALHERFGESLVNAWALQSLSGIRPQDQGELLIWALFGMIGCVILAWGFERTSDLHVEIGTRLLLPIAALVVFGVGVDMLYGPAKDAFPGAGLLLDATEDGGEMVAMTAAVALVAAAHLEIRWGARYQRPR